MKQKFLRTLSLGLVAVLLFGFAACGGNNENPTTTDPTGSIPANEDNDNTTAPPAGDDSTTAPPAGDDSTTAPPAGGGDSTTAPPAGGSGTTAPPAGGGQTNPTTPPANKKPETPAEILNAYTAVMNKAKKELKNYRKLEYQALPKDKINFESSVLSFLLGQAERFMTTREQAMEKDDYTKGTDNLKWFPIYECSVGCMVKDPGVFKSTKSELLPNGNIKLTLVMKDELNSEPPKANAVSSPSNVGGMFTPLAKSNIDETLTTDSILKSVTKDVKYSLNYRSCTAVLVYNPANSQLVSVDLTMNVFITISGKLSLAFIPVNANGTGELNTVLAIDQTKF